MSPTLASTFHRPLAPVDRALARVATGRAALMMVGAALALVAVRPGAAAACSCMQQSQEDAAQNATAIFEGRVTRIEDPEGEPKVHFQVVRTFKGPSQESLVVRTANNGAACGYGFEEGTSYLVYASETDAVLSTGLCSRTQPIADAGEDLGKLGLGVTPFDPGPGSDQPSPDTATEPPAAEPTKGGCASCAIGAREPATSGTGEQRALTSVALLVLGAVYRLTFRRRSGSRS